MVIVITTVHRYLDLIPDPDVPTFCVLVRMVVILPALSETQRIWDPVLYGGRHRRAIVSRESMLCSTVPAPFATMTAIDFTSRCFDCLRILPPTHGPDARDGQLDLLPLINHAAIPANMLRGSIRCGP